MTKLKNTLVLLLVFALVAVGAALPAVSAQLQDRITAGTIQYSDINSLQLTLKERAEPLSMLGKLELISSGISVELTQKDTQMTEGDVIEAVYAGLWPYVGMGIFSENLDNDVLKCIPYLMYDKIDPEMVNIYWWVNLSFDLYEDDTLVVLLDDETGTILAMEYTNPTLDISSGLLEYVEAISATFFGDLGITPTEAMLVDTEGILHDQAAQVQDPGDSHVMMRYLFGDGTYGEVAIEICVYTNGFYISLA